VADYLARRDAMRRQLANVPLPPGAMEDSAGEWMLEDDSAVRVFDHRVWEGSGWRVNLSGLQNADGSVADRWTGTNQWCVGDPIAARAFGAAWADAAEELVRRRRDD
jgi:hypothetical protein